MSVSKGLRFGRLPRRAERRRLSADASQRSNGGARLRLEIAFWRPTVWTPATRQHPCSLSGNADVVGRGDPRRGRRLMPRIAEPDQSLTLEMAQQVQSVGHPRPGYADSLAEVFAGARVVRCWSNRAGIYAK